jgi:anti-sigma B factor antagonist
MNPGIARRGQPTKATAGKLGARCQVEISRVGSSVSVALAGELDVSCARRFGDVLDKAMADGLEDLVIDLRTVTFLDSTGLVLLIKADTLAREEGFHLHIVRSPTEIVRAVFEVSGIDTLLPLADEPPQLDQTDTRHRS